MTLFSFLTPGYMAIKTIPKNEGINAVTEGVSEAKYPHVERLIRIKALNKLAECAFM